MKRLELEIFSQQLCRPGYSQAEIADLGGMIKYPNLGTI